MSGKPAVLRERAQRNIDEAVEHYLAEAGETVALGFIDALEDTRRRIGEQPASCSPRYAHDLDIPGLRYLTVGKFPHLVFYVEGGGGNRCLARPARGAGHTRLDARTRQRVIRKPRGFPPVRPLSEQCRECGQSGGRGDEPLPGEGGEIVLNVDGRCHEPCSNLPNGFAEEPGHHTADLDFSVVEGDLDAACATIEAATGAIDALNPTDDEPKRIGYRAPQGRRRGLKLDRD